MTLPSDRINALVRDMMLGRSRSASTKTPEEKEFWDQVANEMYTEPPKGIVEVPSEQPDPDYLQHLYHDPSA